MSSSISPTRTYGLSGSGIDVDQMVKGMMKASQMRYDALWQKKTLLEWKKAAYNTMYNSINDFRSKTVFNYKLQSTLIVKTASSSNDAAVSIKANADAANMSHSITVTQVADGVKLTSASAITPSGAAKDTLATQFYGGTAPTPATFDIKISNGSASKTITVDTGKSIYELVSNINNAGINVKANYDATLDRFFLYTTNTGASAGISFSGSSDAGAKFLADKLKISTGTVITAAASSTGDVTGNSNDTLATQFAGLTQPFTLRLKNGDGSPEQTITIDPKVNTLDDVMGAINAGGHATAAYDSTNKKFTLTPASGKSLDVSGSDAAALDFLTNNLKLNIGPLTGKDAEFTLDGVNLSEATNNFTISGVTYNIKAEGAANVTVATDTDKIVENVKAFIDAYNTMLGSVNDKLNEPRYADYLPLTDAQKNEMKDSDIKAWEEKSKSGLLRGDSILRTLVDSMRSNLSTPISGLTGKYNSASSIGITTGDYSEKGKLYLDETKLRAALEDDPEIVSKIFGTTSDDNVSSKQGIAVRLYDTLKTASDSIVTEAGITPSTDYDSTSNLARSIINYNKQLADASSRMQDEEDRYYKQFDAMEAALSQMNSQSSWLMQQFSSK